MKSVELTALLIQKATPATWPAEHLDYATLSYTLHKSWESRVSALPGPSSIWTAIPASLKALRGSTSPTLRLLKDKFSVRNMDVSSMFSGLFMDTSSAYFGPGLAIQNPLSRQLLQSSPQRSSASRRGFLELVRAWLPF